MVKPSAYPHIVCCLLRSCCCVLLLMATLWETAAAQSALKEGISWYRQRAAEADSFRAQPRYINNAIEAFERALEEEEQAEQAAAYLLKSYYFKGMYLGLSEEARKRVYDRGKEFGEQMLERFPDSVPIKFWYGANAGRWADVHGFFAAATGGIAKKLRRECQKIIELNPEYQGGGGYRILAQVHFHSPKIPLVMGWPSDDRALELVGKAMEIAPGHPTNLLLQARILLHFNREEKAREHLRTILDTPPRQDNLVEDRFIRYKASQLLNE